MLTFFAIVALLALSPMVMLAIAFLVVGASVAPVFLAWTMLFAYAMTLVLVLRDDGINDCDEYCRDY